jgi:hypothetical protein
MRDNLQGQSLKDLTFETMSRIRSVLESEKSHFHANLSITGTSSVNQSACRDGAGVEGRDTAFAENDYMQRCLVRSHTDSMMRGKRKI